jgi:hypothetical protein
MNKDLFREVGIMQIYVGDDCLYCNEIIEFLNMEKYINNKIPTLFLNVITHNDILKFKSHKGKKYLLLTLELCEITHNYTNYYRNILMLCDKIFIIYNYDSSTLNKLLNKNEIIINIDNNSNLSIFIKKLDKNKIVDPNLNIFGMHYQHNKNIIITKNNYEYVREYKKQLLNNITLLLNDLDIKFVISHGNLIEYIRGEPIYHDDDIDIRFFHGDIYKWEKYCYELHEIYDKKYNLEYDNRIKNFDNQKYNEIQISLINFHNFKNINIYPDIKIHADLVSSRVISDFWMNYEIDYDNLEYINYLDYLDIKTCAPNRDNSFKILSQQYSNNFIILNINIKFFR